MSSTFKITKYEETQNFNKITSFLHSIRYKNILDYIKALPQPVRILEIGCGPGKSFSVLKDHFPDLHYVGIDILPEFISAAKERYEGYPNCDFILGNAADPELYKPDQFDVVLALETLEHIPEATVVRIIENVFKLVRPKLFIASVPVEIGPAIWIKNFGSWLMRYDRRCGNFRQTFWAGLYRLDKLPRHETGHIGFNWYWLEQTIRHNARITHIRPMPFAFLPRFLAPSMMFVAETEPRKQA